MTKKPNADELRDEYDFTPEQLRAGTRGKYAERCSQGVNSLEANEVGDSPEEEVVRDDVEWGLRGTD